MVAPVVRDLLDRHPDLSLALTEREPWDTVDLVASGQQDLGIVHSWGDVPLHVPEHLVGVTIARDVADVIVPKDHRLAGRTRLSPRDLLDEEWVATPEGSICRQWLNRMYDGTGREPRIAHVAMEFDSHLALVGAGLGIALVPRLGRSPLSTDVVAVAVHRPTPTREVTVLHRASMVESPAVRAVVEALGSRRPVSR
jgi:DNA-binding transcriptional LysR family regulator